MVVYGDGQRQTGTLRFRYQKDGSLKVYSYQYSQLGNTGIPANVFVLIMQKMRNI